jgi:hypothetical protein
MNTAIERNVKVTSNKFNVHRMLTSQVLKKKIEKHDNNNDTSRTKYLYNRNQEGAFLFNFDSVQPYAVSGKH